MARVTLSQPGEDITVGGSNVEVFGTTAGGEVITVVSGNITFDASFNRGGDTIILPGLASDYRISQSGAQTTITNASGTVSIKVPVGTAGMEIQFDGGDSRTLALDTSTNPPVARLEGQAITGTPTQVAPGGPAPLVGYDVVGSDTAVVEGDAGTRSMVFTITLDRAVTAADGPVTLNYQTQNGTADSASDYVAAAGQVTFAVGQQVATVTVQVIGDTIPESSETLFLNLTGAALRNGPERLTGTIANDDSAIALTAGADNFTGSAGADTWFAANGALGAGDKITDPASGDGDTLSLSVDATYGQQTKGDTTYSGFTLTNVERVEVTNDAGEQVILDMSGATGVQTVASINSSDSVRFDQLTSLAGVELNNLTDVNSADVDVRYQASLTGGLNDAVKVSVINTNVDDVRLGTVGAGATGIEIVNLDVTGNSTIDTLINNSLRDLNISGTGSVVIDDALSNTVRNIDARQVAGNLDIDFSDNDGAGLGVTFKGAQGVNLVAAGTASDSITTYAGNDVIVDEGGDNVVNAGEGDNNVTTGAGNDQITTGGGNDTINAGNGNNTVSAGDGVNNVTVGTGVDFVTTGSGNDTVVDAGGNATIRTGAGSDTITINGAGRTHIEAGADNDVVTFATDFNADSDVNGPIDRVDMGTGTDELRINAGAIDSHFRNVSSAEILTLQTAGTTVLNNGNKLMGDSFAQAAGIQTINLNQGADVVDASDFTTGLTINSRSTVGGDGGADTVTTGSGDDTFNFGDDFVWNAGANDVLDAGGGTGDVLNLDGKYGFNNPDTFNLDSPGIMIGAQQFRNFERINLGSSVDGTGNPLGNTYFLELNDANAPTNNGTLTIDGSALQGDTDGAGPRIGENVGLTTTNVTAFDLNITTGGGRDIMSLGVTNHVIDTGAANDYVEIAAPMPFSGVNTIRLGDGNDQFVVSTSGGKNTVFGGAGNDYLSARVAGGIEILDGGDGDDVISYSRGGVQTISATEGDVVTGGNGTDYAYFQGGGKFGPDAFASTTSVEVLVAGDKGAVTDITLGAAGEAAGIRTIIDGDEGAASRYDASAYTAGVTFNLEGATVPFGFLDDFTNSTSVFVGGGNDTVIGGKGDDRVILSTGDVNLSLGAGNDTVEAEGSELTFADVMDGGADIDTVLLDNADGQVNANVDLNNVTNFENFTVGSSGDRGIGVDKDSNSITFRNGNVTSVTTLNVNAAALTDLDDTFTITLENTVDADFAFNITGSATRDVLIKNPFGGDNNITFNAGAGDDELQVSGSFGVVFGGGMGSNITYNGGAGTDTLRQIDLGAGFTFTDDAFVNVSSVEVLASTGALRATLGSAAQAAGIRNVVGGTLSDNVTFGAGFTAPVSVTLGGGGNDTFNAAATSAAVTFNAAANELGTGDNLTGGTSNGDVLNIAAGGTSNANNVVGVETINVQGDGAVGGAATPTVLTVDTAVGEVNGGRQTINAVGFLDAGDSFTLNAGAATANLTVNSGAGNDSITTGSGADIINAGGGNNTINSGNGNDEITVTGSGTNTINSGAGNDKITGAAGVDTIDAGTGNDQVDAGGGADIVRGRAGNDTINGDAGDDTLYGDDAYADFAGTAYNPGLSPNAQDPGSQYAIYNASQGAPSNASRDTINGGAGKDTIVGGLGGDTLTGGADADTFLYQTRDDSRVFAGGVDNRDTITDFTSGVDKIDLTFLPEAQGQSIRFNGNWNTFGEGQGAVSGTGNDAFLDVVYVRETNTLWVDIDNNGQLNGEDMQIILQGVTGLVSADVNNPHLVTGPSGNGANEGSVMISDLGFASSDFGYSHLNQMSGFESMHIV